METEKRTSVRSEHREVCVFLLHMLLGAVQAGLREFVWVDIGCGTGAILDAAAGPGPAGPGAIPADLRKRIRYIGYDTDSASVSKAEARLNAAGISGSSLCFCPADGGFSLSDIADGAVHLVTATNVVHEIAPHQLPDMLLQSIQWLSDDGYFLA